MEHLIASFAVDHTDLKPGIYKSRQDKYGDVVITTYDIRMTAPNKEPAVSPSAMHTIEHLAATYLRNNPEWQDNIIYWGPMGCLTGSYLIVKGEYSPEVMRQLMIETFQYIADYDHEVPGTAPANCGNYLLHNLPMAKWEASRYLSRLKDDFHHEYPGVARPTNEDGKTVYDA